MKESEITVRFPDVDGDRDVIYDLMNWKNLLSLLCICPRVGYDTVVVMPISAQHYMCSGTCVYGSNRARNCCPYWNEKAHNG